MNNIITIDVPDELTDAEIEDYFRDNINDLRSAMNLELDDDRAGIDHIEVEHFWLSNDSVHIDYKIEYSAYYGCEDMNYSNEDQRAVSGRRNGCVFEFDIFVPPPERSTLDEL